MANAAKNSELVTASGTDRRRWPARADRIISVARTISKRMTEVILYSFRRCPYAMRARMALSVSGASYEHREVVLRDKPPETLFWSCRVRPWKKAWTSCTGHWDKTIRKAGSIEVIRT